MKDLFKKGKTTPKPTKPKKALFGKNPKQQTTEPAQVASKKPAKSMAVNQANTNKIIAILVVALVLILLALAAKLFLFNDDVVVDDIVVVTESVAEPSVVDESVAESSNDEQPQTETEVTLELNAVVSDVPTDSPVVAVPVENIETVEPVTPQQKQELSYDEFIKETESKIYREHNTK